MHICPLSAYVALLAEGVDRNGSHRPGKTQISVALLAEGVDRNPPRCGGCRGVRVVALLAEGVDRNNPRGVA